jgi:hypothetical protein
MDENEEHASDGDPPRDESSDHEIRGVSSKPPFREKTAQEGKEAKPATSEGYDRGRIFSFVEIGLTVLLVGSGGSGSSDRNLSGVSGKIC